MDKLFGDFSFAGDKSEKYPSFKIGDVFKIFMLLSLGRIL